VEAKGFGGVCEETAVPSAEEYDELINYASRPPDTDATMAGLLEITKGERVLELGVGTGRVAIPLAASGLEVHGIELDSDMADQLHTKPGAERVQVHLGDMTDVDVEGDFDLVYAVFGTLFMLDSQDSQVRCIANVARHLSAQGRFVVEALVPRPDTYTDHRRITLVHASLEQIIINLSVHDPVRQVVETHQLWLSSDGVDIVPNRIRYSWPAELDLMARLAGLELVDRWADWDGRPFTEDDERHISIYGRDDR
jgi:SAM-dependent methyltransferase